MFRSKQPGVLASLFVASAAYICAQAGPSGRSPAGERPPERTSKADRTRAFLGLGTPPDSAAAARGAKLFSSNCAFCHGANATGAEGPDLVRSSVVLHDEKGELIGSVVSKGRAEKGMPSFASFTPEQLYDVAEFLHLRVEEVANRGLYKVQNVVTGDAKLGQAYFNGAGQCKTCHSPSGDLAHVGMKYDPADLQAAFLYPGSVSSFDEKGVSRVTEVTVKLASGQSVSGTLKRLDDFNISLSDVSGNYHSWPRDSVEVEIKDPLAAHRKLLDRYTDADMHNLLAYLVTLK